MSAGQREEVPQNYFCEKMKRLLFRPAPCWSVAFAPNSNSNNSGILAMGSYKKVTFYDVAKSQKLKEIAIGTDAIRALSFAADGGRLAVASGEAGKSGAVYVLDINTGKPVQTISSHEDCVEGVAFAGNLIFSAADDERILVTDIAANKTLATLTEHIGRCLAVAVPSLSGVDEIGGAVFATGGADKAVKIWDAAARRVVVNFDQCQGPVWGVAALQTPGRFVAACDDGKVYVFGVRRDGNKASADFAVPRTGFVAQVLSGHNGPVYCVTTSPNNRFILSGGYDKKAMVWQNGGGRIREMAEATGDIWGVAISPDSKLCATASQDGKVRLYELETGKMLTEVLP
jgi:eukaryotic-like serine/threonine-protein kinase